MSEKEPKVWLRRAESNLRLARRKGRGIFLEDLCFQAQQAAEKALKALMIHLGSEYPKVHSLGLLLEKLEPHVPVPDTIKEAVELSDYAIQTRYPGDYSPVTKAEYERSVELATRVVKWVKSQVKE